jgi:hypothetical protein
MATASAQSAVDLHRNAAAKSFSSKVLLRFSQFPWAAGMGQAGQRRSIAGAAFVTRV